MATTTTQKAEATSAPTTDAALSGFDSLPDAAFVRLPTVAALFATSPSNVWRWVKSGLIPSPKKLGPQTTVWSVKELRQALSALVAGD